MLSVPVAQYMEPIEMALQATALALPRTLACMILLPFSNKNMLPGMLRTGVALSICMPAAAGVFFQLSPEPMGMGVIAMLALKEAAIGFLMGALLAFPFWIFQSIGSLFDDQRRANTSQAQNAAIDTDASVLGGLMIQALVVLFAQLGGLAAVFRLLMESYAMWPVMEWTPPIDEMRRALTISRFSDMVYSILLYTAPLLIMLLLAEFVFAMLGVFVHQLQLSFVLLSPIKNIGGLFVLVAYTTTLWSLAGKQFFAVQDLSVLFGSRPAVSAPEEKR